MLKTLIVTALCCFNFAHIQLKAKQKQDRVICLTIPKSGTHLLIKCLSLFKIPGIETDYKTSPNTKAAISKIRALNQQPPPHHYKGRFHTETVGDIPKKIVSHLHENKKHLIWTHWPHTQACQELFQTFGTVNFLMIRDPRDLIVSFAKMIQKGPHGQIADFDKILLDLIDGRKQYYIAWGVELQEAYPLLWDLGVAAFYNCYTPWMKASNFCVIKFENLVGPKGNGSLDLQLQELAKIAHHLKIAITPEQMRSIAEQLFGQTWTFREGQIGSWKQCFTPVIKDAFKKAPGACQLLIDLHYETDDLW